MPEYGMATLLAPRGHGPLIDPAAPAVPSTAMTLQSSGTSVWELPAGMLIGRCQRSVTIGQPSAWRSWNDSWDEP
jgi:hypothetical protein